MPDTLTKYVVITGGVLSGLGKGITTSSIGRLLQSHGFKVSAIKIDPYLNVDAGTMRPTEHGEVWVTEDGGEIDQDLGNYERFLDVTLNKDHNITSGKVYWNVLNKERKGEYLGKTVQPIPHVIEEINDMVTKVSSEDKCDFMMIEVGGQVGDYENILFLEAMRQLRFTSPVMFIHVGYLPIPEHLGEMKTKPLQHSIHALRSRGIIPDIIIGRSSKPMDDNRKRKIALTSGIPIERVLSNIDVDNIYSIPLILKDQGLDKLVLQHFGQGFSPKDMGQWGNFINRIKSYDKKIVVGLVGKYFDTGNFSLTDSYISVIEAIKHASWNNERSPEIAWIDSKDFESDSSSLKNLDKMDCVIVPGGFGNSGVEGKILTSKYCRENSIPYLGLCLGLQVAVIDFARHVCGLSEANSTEFNQETTQPVICILPEQIEKMKKSQYGATMRLGGQDVKISEGTKANELYGSTEVRERFRHRFEVNPDYVDTLKSKGLVFSGTTPDGEIMQIIEIPEHPFFMASQFHPEFTSRPMKPNPLFNALLKSAVQKSDSR